MKSINKITLLFVLLYTTGLQSCEYSYPYTYIVSNRTDTAVTIHIHTFYKDSLFQLQSMSTDTLYQTNHGIEGSRGPYFRSVDKDLDSFVVIKKGNVSRRNYRRDSCWTFDDGDYKTTITDDEF